MSEQQRGITAEQYETLMKPLRASRVAKRSQGGKQLSYLEAWEVKAHLTRVFGFGNWDSEVVDYGYVGAREYKSQSGTDMVEVIYRARVQLTIRDQWGNVLCQHSEVAVGSTSGPASMLGEHHDNAVKTAASDALKRCAINLGTQFGLSLYDNGSTNDVIRQTLIKPEGYVEPEKPGVSADVASRIGAVVEEGPAVTPTGEASNDGGMQSAAEAHADHSDQAAEDAERDQARAEPEKTGLEQVSQRVTERLRAEQASEQARTGIVTTAVIRSQVAQAITELNDEDQAQLKEWWSAQGYPRKDRINAEQGTLILARIGDLKAERLLKDGLGAQEVPA